MTANCPGPPSLVISRDEKWKRTSQLPDRLRVPRQIDAQGASAMLLDGRGERLSPGMPIIATAYPLSMRAFAVWQKYSSGQGLIGSMPPLGYSSTSRLPATAGESPWALSSNASCSPSFRRSLGASLGTDSKDVSLFFGTEDDSMASTMARNWSLMCR